MSLLSHTYLRTPQPPDTQPPRRYACGSSGSRASPPTLGTPPPPRPKSPPYTPQPTPPPPQIHPLPPPPPPPPPPDF